MIGAGFIALSVLALIHIVANQRKVSEWVWQGHFLSIAGGMSFAYVFVGLLPKLAKGQPVLKTVLDPILPYLDHHTYIIALLGFLFFYGVHVKPPIQGGYRLLLALGGYILFNFFVGATLSDSRDPDIQPLALFTAAMGMHYFIRDHNIGADQVGLYQHRTRWILVGALLLGYVVGTFAHINNAVVTIAVSFLAGGVFLNILRYELPKREQVGYGYFVAGAFIYTALLLGLGEVG